MAIIIFQAIGNAALIKLAQDQAATIATLSAGGSVSQADLDNLAGRVEALAAADEAEVAKDTPPATPA